MKENGKLLSLRTNLQIVSLFKEGEKYQPTISRIELFNQAIEYVIASDNINWKELAGEKVDYEISDSEAPGFVQLRVDDQKKWDSIVNQIKNSFTPPLQRTTTPYVVKLCLQGYIKYLSSIQPENTVEKENNLLVDEDELKNKEKSYSGHHDMSDLELAERFLKLLLANHESDKYKDQIDQIKSIIANTMNDI